MVGDFVSRYTEISTSSTMLMLKVTTRDKHKNSEERGLIQSGGTREVPKKNDTDDETTKTE